MASSNLTVTLHTRVWYTFREAPEGVLVVFHLAGWLDAQPGETEPLYVSVPPMGPYASEAEAEWRAEERLAAIRSRLND